MKKIGIVTDSHSSISPAEAALIGVHVLPMPFDIDGQEYFEGVNITRQQFFGYQRAGARIGTSQPAPAAVMELWDELLEQYESLLYMPISSGLSHSCQTAMALAEEEPYAGRIFVVDNGRVGSPLHQSILDALELIDKGLSAAECKAALEAARNDLVIYIAVETLEHLKRGGRISSTAAAVGTLLNIKPILWGSEEGTIVMKEKVRGRKRSVERLLDAYDAKCADHGAVAAITHADSPEDAELLCRLLREHGQTGEMIIECFEPAMGAHVGPGALALFFFGHDRAG